MISSRFIKFAMLGLLLAASPQILSGLTADDLLCADDTAPAMPAEEEVESTSESKVEKSRPIGVAVTMCHEMSVNSLWQILSSDAARNAEVALVEVEVPRGPPAV